VPDSIFDRRGCRRFQVEQAGPGPWIGAGRIPTCLGDRFCSGLSERAVEDRIEFSRCIGTQLRATLVREETRTCLLGCQRPLPMPLFQCNARVRFDSCAPLGVLLGECAPSVFQASRWFAEFAAAAVCRLGGELLAIWLRAGRRLHRRFDWSSRTMTMIPVSWSEERDMKVGELASDDSSMTALI